MKKTLFLLLLLTIAFSSCKKDDPVIVEYTVSFDSQGGSGLAPVTVPEGSKVTKPQDPTKENYIFSGWYKDAGGTTAWDFDKETVMSNVTLYAKWVEIARACVVTFDSQGGSEVAPLTVNKGEKLAKPTDPTKEDCKFLGWYKDAAYTSAWEFGTDVVNENITLYARWSNPGEAVYTVTFDTDGGNEMEPASVKGNEKAIKPADPVKLGFNFENWYSDPEKQTVYDFETLVTGDMTLYAKWEKAEIALVEFNATELAGAGIVWDEETKTLDISEAKASAAFSFNVVGIVTLDKDVQAKFDTQAKSIGGTENILTVGEAVGNKISVLMNVPAQTIKVPLDISVKVYESGNPDAFETITITSRPDYNGTGIKPVMMKTTDDELVFWAPVNAGAKKMPASVTVGTPTPGGTNDITDECGEIFQWGRKYGFANTNNSTVTEAEKYDGKANELGFPMTKRALAEMSKWDGMFIVSSASSPDTKENWLLLTENVDNVPGYAMVDGAWYQQLWNKGTEDAPVKTEYDPCPDGWRVPTGKEWRALGLTSRTTEATTAKWNSATNLVTIDGAVDGQKLVIPAAGYRTYNNGVSGMQGTQGHYWTSSSKPENTHVIGVYFDKEKREMAHSQRSAGTTLRCVQE